MRLCGSVRLGDGRAAQRELWFLARRRCDGPSLAPRVTATALGRACGNVRVTASGEATMLGAANHASRAATAAVGVTPIVPP